MEVGGRTVKKDSGDWKGIRMSSGEQMSMKMLSRSDEKEDQKESG